MHQQKLYIEIFLSRTLFNPTYKRIPYSGMCPGLGEWWLHKGVLNL